MSGSALVLGGGGPVGIAWETGLLLGLSEGGVDLRGAGLIVGTSAGSVVGAQLAMGREIAQMYAAVAIQVAPEALAARPVRPPAGPETAAAPDTLSRLRLRASSGEISREELLRQIGSFAVEAATISEEAFLATFGKTLGTAEAWPAQPFLCTAVDVATGEFAAWTASSGVPLNRAVASSCSVPGTYPPITINGRRYMDGGMRSRTNADAARGARRVMVVAVTAGEGGPMTALSRTDLSREVEILRAGGAEVTVVMPDEAALRAFGPNLMDFTRRPGAAEAGRAQGRALAADGLRPW